MNNRCRIVYFLGFARLETMGGTGLVALCHHVLLENSVVPPKVWVFCRGYAKLVQNEVAKGPSSFGQSATWFATRNAKNGHVSN